MLPNLLIAGVHKAGTTSLYHYLGKHPEIFASRTKETQFLSMASRTGVFDAEAYAKHFADAGSQRYRMEASPMYLYCAGVPHLIRNHLPGTKVIVILRDPAERLLSFYDRAYSQSDLSLSFDEFLIESQRGCKGRLYARGLSYGYYAEHLELWRDILGDNLKVVFFDDLQADSMALTASICEWLGLDSTCLKRSDFTVENMTLHYRHKRLHRVTVGWYRKSERFWRKHDRLKRFLRRAYNWLNSGTVRIKAEIASDTELAKLREIYEPHNRALKEFLIANDYRPLPRWLT